MSAYISEPCEGGISYKLRGCFRHKYYFDPCRACFDIQAREKGKAEERELIVKFLSLSTDNEVARLIDAIERGEHLRSDLTWRAIKEG